VAEYVWSGDEAVVCEIEIETVGDRRKAEGYKAIPRRIQRDGLLPLALANRRAAEYQEISTALALARAKLFLDRRFGFGTISEGKGETNGMRLFALERAPDELVIAEFGRYGCPVCRIGEPDDAKLGYWLEHARREHGYEVVSDRREPAPGLPDANRRFRVIRLRWTPPQQPAVAGREGEGSTAGETPSTER
jgi:hypothetical protein